MCGAAENVLNQLLVNLVEGPGHDNAYPEARDQKHNESVENCNGREDGDANEPKPEEDIYFFVDDIECKNTEAIMPGNGSGWTILVESALRHL